MKSWRDFAIGLIVGLIIIPLGVWFYFRLGLVPVSAKAQAMPFEKYLAKMALHSRVDKEAGVQSPIQPTEANLTAGAQIYRSSCAPCHALPGQDQTVFEKGMFPKPPELLKGKGVTDDPVGVTHWVVQNGIRLSGMPAFQDAYSDEQLWQVSLLLAKAHELPQSVEQLLRQPAQ